MKLKFGLLPLAAALAALLIQGASPALAETVKVAVGQRGNWDTLVTQFALDRGYFKDEGLDVEITWTRGGGETLRAVTTGSVALGMANGTQGVIGAFAKGAPVRIVSSQAVGAGDIFWYAKTSSGIKSFKDTNGRSVGYSRPGSSTNLVALALAKEHGVTPKLVATGGIPGTRTQVMSGQVDAGWSVPPFNLDLVAKGEVLIIARGTEAKDISKQSIRVNIANAFYLNEHRETLTKFMRAYSKALDWMYSDMDASVAAFAKFNKLDLAVAKEAVTFFPQKAVAMTPVLGLQESMEQAVDDKKLKKPLGKGHLKDLLQIVFDPKNPNPKKKKK